MSHLLGSSTHMTPFLPARQILLPDRLGRRRSTSKTGVSVREKACKRESSGERAEFGRNNNFIMKHICSKTMSLCIKILTEINR